MTKKEIWLEHLEQNLERINNQLKKPEYLGSIAIECMNQEKLEIKQILHKNGI
jgi:G:T-mismatch repair DNA endonuclease (very short patch repair protein)